MDEHCATCTCAQPDFSDRPWKEHPVDDHHGRLWCPATTMVGKQALSCLHPGHHDGPHLDRIVDPCPFCGAWDEHADWCALCDWENVVWAIQRILGNRRPHRDTYANVVRFAHDAPGDEATYWIEPPDSASSPPPAPYPKEGSP